MLYLDSPRWSELRHAYGDASNIPDLLRSLSSLPAASGGSEPWFTLWSALAHQGDVYSASFAAVPHVVHALSTDPARADSTYFQFPAWVEVCRRKTETPVPEDLRADYEAAISTLPNLIAAAASGKWDEEKLTTVMMALAAAKGFHTIAEAAQELTTETAEQFLDWFYDQ